MTVKLLLTWDIKPGREQEYFEFVVREFMPGMQRLGLQPSEAWVTTYGDKPQIMTGMVAEDQTAVRKIMGSEDWQSLHDRLLEYVNNLESKIIHASGGFQV
ncbi:MAG: hypothetical protein K8R91_06350 [Phycisphaerae bacterium]|nr:hypothetical protein [Phycisphaerae bacterium]